VKAIDELKTEREEQGKTQQNASRQIDAQACKHDGAPAARLFLNERCAERMTIM
jgi:hypothetical protein